MSDPNRVTGLGPHQMFMLNVFGGLVEAAWGELPYLVGSAARGVGWRDVDVRVMLSNEEYERRLGPIWQGGMRHQSPRWRAEMAAWTKLGEALTGLPIDFQVERATEANELYPHDRRIALMTWRYRPPVEATDD